MKCSKCGHEDAPPETEDLSFVSTEALVNELASRFPHCIIGMEGPAEKEGDEWAFSWMLRGGVSAGIGMSIRLKQKCLKISDEADESDEAEPSNQG